MSELNDGMLLNQDQSFHSYLNYMINRPFITTWPRSCCISAPAAPVPAVALEGVVVVLALVEPTRGLGLVLGFAVAVAAVTALLGGRTRTEQVVEKSHLGIPYTLQHSCATCHGCDTIL